MKDGLEAAAVVLIPIERVEFAVLQEPERHQSDGRLVAIDWCLTAQHQPEMHDDARGDEHERDAEQRPAGSRSSRFGNRLADLVVARGDELGAHPG